MPVSSFQLPVAVVAITATFFEQPFGRGARGRREQRAQAGDFGGTPEQMRGSDHHAKIELDILDAYDGAERTITLRSARQGDDGRVVNEGRSLQVKIPKGVHEEQHIRLAGRGSPGTGGAAAGDLLLDALSNLIHAGVQRAATFTSACQSLHGKRCWMPVSKCRRPAAKWRRMLPPGRPALDWVN